MRKALLILVLCVASTATVSAAGLYLTPSAEISVGISNYFRGGSIGALASYDVGFLQLGLEVRADYDLSFNSFDIPLILVVGLGRDFWIGVGYTIPVGSPWILGTDGSHIAWALGGFPNTYTLGVNILHVKLPIGVLQLRNTISYIVNNSANPNDAYMSSVASVLYGIKAEAGFALALRAL